MDAIGIAVAPGAPPPNDLVGVGTPLADVLSEVVSSGEHRGRLQEILLVPTAPRRRVPRILLYGVGAPQDLDGQRLRFAHDGLVRAARGHGYRRLAIVSAPPLRPEHLAGVVEGSLMGTWDERARQTGRRPAVLEELSLVGFGEGRADEIALARRLGIATVRVRELQNTPANELWPETLSGIAREIAGRNDRVEVEVLGPEDLEREGYRLLLSVGMGSTRPPQLIRLQYRGAPPGSAKANLALIGKGITFDSGGLSIKTEEGMILMRADMSAGATVLSALDVIAASGLPVDVMGVVAAAENMPSGQAQRPGDVWVSANGKTVEVLSTDAEGRLVLADALTFALRRGATHLVDLATLTRASLDVTGTLASPAISNNDELWALAADAAQRAGERLWRMPIYPEYRELLDSSTADLRNGFYGEAGMITAGLFVGEFAEGRPWVHIDMGASAWNRNSKLRSMPQGALGTGTRLCFHLAALLADDGRPNVREIRREGSP